MRVWFASLFSALVLGREARSMRNVWQADSAGGSAGASAGVPAGSSVGGSANSEGKQGFVQASHHVPRHARPGMERDYEDGPDDGPEDEAGPEEAAHSEGAAGSAVGESAADAVADAGEDLAGASEAGKAEDSSYGAVTSETVADPAKPDTNDVEFNAPQLDGGEAVADDVAEPNEPVDALKAMEGSETDDGDKDDASTAGVDESASDEAAAGENAREASYADALSAYEEADDFVELSEDPDLQLDADESAERESFERLEAAAHAAEGSENDTHFSDEPVVPGALEDDPDIGDESTSEAGYSGPSSNIRRLNQNAMAPVVGARKSSDVRWQDVHPKTPGKKRELKHTRGWFQAVVVCIVMAVVAAGLIAGVTYHLEMWGGKTVPSVVGLVTANATSRLQEKGLQVQVNYVPSDDGNDRVISADPGTGTRVADGSTVTLTVGQSRVLPTVTGMNVQDARSALEAAGATNIRLTYTKSTEAEGTVLSVSPAEGSTFISSDLITLTIAQLPVVPDVVGRTQADALQVLQDAGLSPTVVYSSEGTHQKGYVEKTSPAAGARADERGSVKVTVMSPMPSDIYHVGDYTSALPAALSYFLNQEGYVASVGYTDQDGKVVEKLDVTDGGSVILSPTPWAKDVQQQSGSTASDVLASAANLDGIGVRLSLSVSETPQLGATVGAANQLIQECGLEGATDTRDETNVQLPSGVSASGHDFYCVYGESGDNAWCVIVYVNDQKKTQAEVVWAPKSLLSGIDTSSTGGSMASYLVSELLLK